MNATPHLDHVVTTANEFAGPEAMDAIGTTYHPLARRFGQHDDLRNVEECSNEAVTIAAAALAALLDSSPMVDAVEAVRMVLDMLGLDDLAEGLDR